MTSRAYRLASVAGIIAIPSLVWVASALAAEPETARVATPDLVAAVLALMGALTIYFRSGTASKVDADKNHKSLETLLVTFATEGRTTANRVADELKDHQIVLARWMGGVDEKLGALTGKVATVEREVGSVLAKSTHVNYRLKALEHKAGISTTGEIPKP